MKKRLKIKNQKNKTKQKEREEKRKEKEKKIFNTNGLNIVSVNDYEYYITYKYVNRYFSMLGNIYCLCYEKKKK